MAENEKAETGGLYRALEPLLMSRRDQYLVPTSCYPHLARVTAVPIAHLEAWQLATAGPILWRDGAAGLELILVITKPLTTVGFNNLVRPRLSVAYPFAAANLDDVSKATAEGDGLVMWDRPQEPLPAGVTAVPIFDAKGQFVPAAQEKIEALLIYASARERTASLTRHLVEQQLLQPWSAHLTLGGIARPLLGAWRASDDWLDRLDRSKIPDGDLAALYELIEAHLISLRHPDLKIGRGGAAA